MGVDNDHALQVMACGSSLLRNLQTTAFIDKSLEGAPDHWGVQFRSDMTSDTSRTATGWLKIQLRIAWPVSCLKRCLNSAKR